MNRTAEKRNLAKEPPSGSIERRAFTALEFRQDGQKIVGHAAVFNVETDLGWFRERIEPGAFTESIGKDDIRALLNHDANFVLGRNRAKTLTLREDQKGLAVEIEPPDTQWARDLAVTIGRGDISQMSFGFITLDAEWQTKDGVDVRILKRAQLFDVSPVTFAAYPQTDVALRSHESWKKERDSAAGAEEQAAAKVKADSEGRMRRARAVEIGPSGN